MDLWRLFNMTNLYHVHHLRSFLKDGLSRLYCHLCVYISYIGRMEPCSCPTAAVEVVTAWNRCLHKGSELASVTFWRHLMCLTPSQKIKGSEQRSAADIIATAALLQHYCRLKLADTNTALHWENIQTLCDKPEHQDERRRAVVKSTSDQYRLYAPSESLLKQVVLFIIQHFSSLPYDEYVLPLWSLQL